MQEYIREFIKYKSLLYVITWREIRIKYKQSVMGFLWAILMPIFIIAAGLFVRFAISRLTGKGLDFSQVASIAVKATPWAFFISSVRFATNSLTGNINLVTKIYFPKEIFPVSAVLSQFFDFLISSLVVITLLFFGRIGVSQYLLWTIPLIILLFLMTMGLGIFLSAANLFLRDVKYIVEVFLTFAIFFTPVFYDASFAGNLEWLILLNPVAPVLEALNACVVLKKGPDWSWILYSAAVTLAGLWMAIKFFKKLEPIFAERV